MKIIQAQSPTAQEAHKLVKGLQSYFVTKLNALSLEFGEGKSFEAISWGRDEGLHGGGERYEARDSSVFDRGSVNVSQVHYDDDDTKSLSSATALSTIIHPNNPYAPSIHIHISWTQMRDGKGYWRVMADLNPSLINLSTLNKRRFLNTLEKVTGDLFSEGNAQGDRYFFIPSLDRHRGVAHYYLEGYNSGDFINDKIFIQKIIEGVINTYISIVTDELKANPTFEQDVKKEQLAYHTLYLFQVLTLDRGTTSGLLVHNQNDVGIMGSLPSHIDRDLLKSWIPKMTQPQDKLLQSLINALPNTNPTPIEEDTKIKLANAVREHYKAHKEALSLQASGGIIPPTVDNHR